MQIASSENPTTPAQVLKTVFGYDSFRPLQAEIINAVLAGRDTLAIMPTGGGKSLCYQVPALLFEGLTIVISPLIALMQDQVSFLRDAGVRALFLNSSLDKDSYRENMALIRGGEIKLLYLAPESLVTGRIQDLLSSVRVDCITIDEAHCISEWGHDFRPEYRKIAAFRAQFPSAVCLALTATATAKVRGDIKKTLHLSDPAQFIASFDRPNIFLEVRQKQKPLEQIIDFVRGRAGESGIIYCFSRKAVDELCERLNEAGCAALSYHAGLRDELRLANQARFIADEVPLMVATLAFGMGINKPNVRFVIHQDLPKSLEQYYQEIGRAGRDGEPATALLLYSAGDTRKLRFFLEDKEAGEIQKAEAQLRLMTGYAESNACRRRTLLAHFGETYAPAPASETPPADLPCCDICCRVAVADTDVTVPAQKLLSCVLRTGERFGAAYVIDVLLGSKQKRIVDNGHHKISTWGIGEEFSKDDWNALARLLLEYGYLAKDDDYGVLSLTAEARSALAKREVLCLPFRPATIRSTRTAGSTAGSGGSGGGSLKFAKKTGALDPLDSTGTLILDSLKKLRRGLAEAAAVPPYVIFSDKTLEDIAAKKP